MTVTKNIFEFWRPAIQPQWAEPGRRCVHPDDEPYLVGKDSKFELDIPPGHVNGRLKTAPIVACFLNPGYEDQETRFFSKAEGRRLALAQTAGEFDFPRVRELDRWWKWFRPRVQFEGISDDELAANVAVLNICAYASRNAASIRRGFIRNLPSAEVAKAYLHEVLLPDARDGKRFIVICRAAWAWEVPDSAKGKNLEFASPRGGYFGPEIRAKLCRWWKERGA